MFVLRSISACVAGALLSAVGAAAASNWLPGDYPAAIDHVVDGDTIAVKVEIWVDLTLDVNVRLEGVDAPETRFASCDAERAKGEAATAFVENLGLETLILNDVRHGKYARRVVARVMTPDGRNLSDMLVESGHAVYMPDDSPNFDWCADDLEDARDDAR